MSPAPADAAATPIDLAMMGRALELARAAGAAGEVPVGAVVYVTADVGGARIVGEAGNERERTQDPSAHAELLALRQAAATLGTFRLTDCTLVVTLEPCPMCAGAVVNARVGRLVFGCTDPKAGACGTLMSITTDPRLNHRVTPIGGVMAEESAALLRDFFKSLRAGGGA